MEEFYNLALLASWRLISFFGASGNQKSKIKHQKSFPGGFGRRGFGRKAVLTRVSCLLSSSLVSLRSRRLVGGRRACGGVGHAAMAARLRAGCGGRGSTTAKTDKTTAGPTSRAMC